MAKDKDGNEIDETLEGEDSNVDEKDNVQSERASKRIRELVASNKALTEQVKELAEKVTLLSEKETEENVEENQDAESGEVDEKINKIDAIDEKVKKMELDSFKKTIELTGVLSAKDLEDIDTIDGVKVAVNIANKLKTNFDSNIEEKAKDLAKIIVDQEKLALDGDKTKNQEATVKFKNSLKKNNWI